ncbi:MAG: hypothetical protein NUV97_01015 [archaeon]|nr:hypothetical protein [archaeon]MCR4323459.1 hypothetical protein [Nanoarchaeota archaeon]
MEKWVRRTFDSILFNRRNEKMEKTERDYRVEFEVLRKQYDLPEFKGLAEDFDIEKTFDSESNFLLREIRRGINEKLAAYLHLFETLISPNAPPMFIFSVLRKISEEDRKEIKEIYKNISRLELGIMKLDTVYSEENEAEFIKLAFGEWQEMKHKILKIIENFNGNFDESSNSTQKGYFG